MPDQNQSREDPAVLATPEGSEAYWRHRHEGQPGWAEHYWQSQDLPERQAIKAALEQVAPFGSVLELGCNAGANLALIRRRWPAVWLMGVDINPEALETCRMHFDQDPALWPPPRMRMASLYDLDDLPDGGYDVVLTSSVLIHVPPERIGQVLAAAWRLARKALVLCELHGSIAESRFPGGILAGQVRPGKWAYDYAAALDLLTEFPAEWHIEHLPPDVGWDTNARDGQRYRSVNAVITVRRR